LNGEQSDRDETDEIGDNVETDEIGDNVETLQRQQMQCDLQWHGIVENFKTALADASADAKCWIPVADVSGSMAGEPLEVSIALSMLLAEVNRGQFHGQIFTFHENPELVTVFSEEQYQEIGVGEGRSETAVVCPVLSAEEIEIAATNSLSIVSEWAFNQFSPPTSSESHEPFYFANETLDQTMETQLVSSDNSPKKATKQLRDIGEAAFKVSKLPWGGSTDLLKTMELFCELAIKNNTTRAEMKHFGLVIFSDMQFDEAIGGWDDDGDDDGNERWETTYEKILAIFEEAAYPMPKMVFWNLRATHSVPVAQDTKGVVLLSGFSAGLLKSFLAGDLEEFTPNAQLRAVLDHKAYSSLRVF
jgi:hypothetical protein